MTQVLNFLEIISLSVAIAVAVTFAIEVIVFRRRP